MTRSETATASWILSGLALHAGLVLCIWLPYVTESTHARTLTYFLAMAGLGAVTVFVSRMRNRNSFWWFTFATTGTNGFWFMGIGLLLANNAPWFFFFLAVTSVLAGRTISVRFAIYLEDTHKLVADAARNPASVAAYLKQAHLAWWGIGALLMSYLLWLAFTTPSLMHVASIVAILGFLQNFIYAQKTRLTQRGKNDPNTVLPIALMSVASWLTYPVSLVYLAYHGFAPLLFVPYVLATVAGSTYGVTCSMRREIAMQVGGDDHIDVEKKKPSGTQSWLVRDAHYVYVLLGVLGVAWFAFHEPIAAALNLTLPTLVFPFWDEWHNRYAALIAIAGIVFMQNVAHTFVASAGVRDHVGYHAKSITFEATFDFIKTRAILLNHTWDIIPIIMVAGTLGVLYARLHSAKIEKRIGARMDSK